MVKDYSPPQKKKKRFWIITCTTIWVCHHYYGVCFAYLLILEYPDHHQNLISSLLYYPGPLHKISSQSVHSLLSNVVHRQTDRQTNRQTNATKNVTSFAKEVKSHFFVIAHFDSYLSLPTTSNRNMDAHWSNKK